MASTSVPEPTDKTPEPTRDEVVQDERKAMLALISAAVTAGLPAPSTVDLHSYSDNTMRIEFRMDDNKPDQVDAWAAAAGGTTKLGGVLETGTRRWRKYVVGGVGKRVTWHGWDIEVWSAVDEPEESAS